MSQHVAVAHPRLSSLGAAATITVGAAIAGLYTLFSLRQWSRFDVPSWDLGIFTQTVDSYAHLRPPISDIKGANYFILGDHFHPLLALLAPIFRLFPTGATLLVIQALLIGLSAGVLCRCAAKLVGAFPAMMLSVGYGLAWGLQSAVASQFHEIALAVPLIALSCAALVERRHLAAVLWSLPLIGVKETLGLTVAAVGVVVFIRGSRKLGALAVIGGMTAFVVTTAVILPALSPSGEWAYAGDSVLSRLASDPAAALAGFFESPAAKLLLVFATFAITGGLALLSPIAVLTLPTLAWRLTSNVPAHWSLDWHYSAILMPMVFFATLDAMKTGRLRRFAVPISAGLLIAAVAVTAAFPLRQLVDPGVRPVATSADAAHEVLDLIPRGASVDTDITLMAYLAPRTTVYWVGNEGNPVPDYVVVNQNSGVYPDQPPANAAEYARQKFPGASFHQIYDRGGFLVAERAGL